MTLEQGQQNVLQRLLPLFNHLNCLLFAFQYPDCYLAVLEDTLSQKCLSSLEDFFEENRSSFSGFLGKAQDLEGLSSSYSSCLLAEKSAALSKKAFCSFDSLTLELLLLDKEEELREEYLKKSIKNLTPKDLSLLSVYYAQEMSLSKTSAQLFLHKNTLQYKLDRIRERSSLNPRKFQDAVILYLALYLTGNLR